MKYQRKSLRNSVLFRDDLAYSMVRGKFNGLPNIFLVLVWMGNICVTNFYEISAYRVHGIFAPLRSFFIVDENNNFPGLEVICLIFFALLFWRFRNCYVRPSGPIRLFLWISLLFVVLALANPRNELGGILGFFSFRITRTILLFLVFSAAIMLLDVRIYRAVIEWIFRVGFYVALGKACFDLGMFVIGQGLINVHGRHIASYGIEPLWWYGIFHVLLFSLYLHSKRKKYLFLSIVFFLCLLFSYSRTVLFDSLLVDILLMVISVFVLRRKIRQLLPIFGVSAVVFILLFMIAGKPFFSDLMFRYQATLKFTGLFDIAERGIYDDYTDSGHIRQSVLVTQYFFQNLTNFWGGGLNRRGENYLYISGQSEGGVHNNIVSLWQFFGIPGVLYLISLSLFFVYLLARLIAHRKTIGIEYFLCLTVAVFFLVRFVVGWFSGDYFYLLLQLALQYIFLISVVKLLGFTTLQRERAAKTEYFRSRKTTRRHIQTV